MKKVRIGIIGTNFISDRLALAASEVDSVEITAVYSRKRDTGEAFAEKYGIKHVYTCYLDMLESGNIDAVYVASPTFLHKEHSILAMQRNVDVLCEKAVALNLSEFLEMRRCAEVRGRVLVEAMRPAFDPALSVILKALSRIGKVRRASLEFCKYSSRYDKFKRGIVENAFDPTIGNSSLLDIGVYPTYLAVRLFGEPVSVKSSFVKLENGFMGAGASILSYPDKCVTVTHSKISESARPSVIEGELGSILIDKVSEPCELVLSMNDGTRVKLNYTPRPNNMVHELEFFASAVQTREGWREPLDVSESLIRTMDRMSADFK